jgi:ATP-dependent DNA helicase RecG
MEPALELTSIKGVGPELAKKLEALGLHTPWEVINYWPRRYEDFSNVQPISEIKPGPVTIEAVIKQARGRYVRRGMHITEAVASDESGSVRLVWFNQPYRAEALRPRHTYYISGDFQLSHQRLSILNPSAELAKDFPVNTARIIPVYGESKGLKSAQIRKIIAGLMPSIDAIPEMLPEWLLEDKDLMPRHEAIKQLHFPSSSDALSLARRRLGFEEVFVITLASLLTKYELLQEKALQVPFKEELAKAFVSHLPFQLTDAQRKVVWQIYKDMDREMPMNRLVEGDVGSGKTVVATMAALMAMEQGFQVALMAPTEILARQHAETIFKLLEPVGFAESVSVLVGSLKPAQKKAAQERIASGDIRFMVGTNALIQEKVDMHRLGLVVIDEQHRFGVEQRKKLQAKAGHMPHVLSMTATPIPRSLALTLYGEMDISLLDVMPTGRKPIITRICSPNSRDRLYADIDQELEQGRQCFVVCPLITESDKLQVASAEKVYDKLRKGPFKHRRVGLLHGKLKAEEKDAVMQQFADHHIDILVATTVIEVGVNVPNATVMVVEAAERFGLAQIHQLRGRVGRGGDQGYCYLVLSDSKSPSPRLRALEQSTDGFRLAELDLRLRGPGAIYGTMQHGALDLRIAKLSDTRLIASARQASQEFIDKHEQLDKYPGLSVLVKKAQAVTRLN